jgi:N-acetyl sugar amidotransferase
MDISFKAEFCKLCTISNYRPSSCVEFKNNNSKKEYIKFNNGICSACDVALKYKPNVDWEERKNTLDKLLEQLKSDRTYDIIIPASGGKDSTYTTYILKTLHKAKCLSVTWSPHIYTTPGFMNLQNMIHSLGIDNILLTPNGKVHRLLTKLAFKNILHPFQPFILGQKNIALKMAVLHDVSAVFYGENEADYGNNVDQLKVPFRKLEHCVVEDDENFDDYIISGIKVKDLINKYNLTLEDLEPYLPLKRSELKGKDIKIYYAGYFYPWDPQDVYYKVVKECNFKPNDHRTEGSYCKYSSFDDRTDGFHYFTTWIKFGIGRCTYDSSQEIRNGKITRDEGVKLVEKYDGEIPLKFLPEFLNYIDVNLDEFFEIIDKFRNPNLWEKIDKNKWKLKFTSFGKEKIDNSYFIAKKYLEEGEFITPLIKYEKLDF